MIAPRNRATVQTMVRRAMVAFSLAALLGAAQTAQKGIVLENLTWIEAERILTPDAVVVIPLGAESKEHGPHLLLKNDFVMAEYLKNRVLRETKVVVAPALNYSFYPAFLDYPGSTSLELDTARNMVVEVCRSLARHGPKRFYILNTGVSTLSALRPAAAILAGQGIEMRFSDVLRLTADVEKEVKQEEGGTHAEELETSQMLYMAPETVNMKKAVKDYHPSQPGGLRRNQDGSGTYSASGTWGDATLATREKGKKLTEAAVKRLLLEIEALRSAPLPARTLDRLDLAKYAGIYATNSGKAITVKVENGSLQLDGAGPRRATLNAISEWRFSSGYLPVSFAAGKDGRVDAVTIVLAGVETTAYRKTD